MDVDPERAAALGFPKSRYTFVERERRWLCRAVPTDLVIGSSEIADVYVAGLRLRLRDERPDDRGPARRRLTRKVDVDACTRLMSSIYLPDAEFAALAAMLHGARLRKRRHRLPAPDGATIVVDEFLDALAGLVVAEVECATDAALSACAAPPFAVREITGDDRFSGARLAARGLPLELPALLAGA